MERIGIYIYIYKDECVYINRFDEKNGREN